MSRNNKENRKKKKKYRKPRYKKEGPLIDTGKMRSSMDEMARKELDQPDSETLVFLESRTTEDGDFKHDELLEFNDQDELRDFLLASKSSIKDVLVFADKYDKLERAIIVTKGCKKLIKCILKQKIELEYFTIDTDDFPSLVRKIRSKAEDDPNRIHCASLNDAERVVYSEQTDEEEISKLDRFFFKDHDDAFALIRPHYEEMMKNINMGVKMAVIFRLNDTERIGVCLPSITTQTLNILGSILNEDRP